MTRTATRTLGVLIRAAGAVFVMAALAIGVPILLAMLFGNPIPQQWSWTDPLSDAVILRLLACVAWLFWAQIMVCLVVEVIAEVRIAAGHSADWLSRLPGTFGGQQALARTLVHAVIAVGLTSAVAAVTTSALPARADAAGVPVIGAQPQPRADASTSVAAPIAEAPTVHEKKPPTSIVEVAKGDSLWSIADQHLGNGERWREIAELNEGRLMPGGSRFRNAGSIIPGWTLLIPDTATLANAPAVATVQRGDTLWGLAERAYGDGEDWPQIFDANRSSIEEPGLIFPGQRLRIPSQRSLDPPHPEPGTHDPGEEQHDPAGGTGHGRTDAPSSEPSEEPTSLPSDAGTPTPEATTPPLAVTDSTTGTNRPEASDEEVGSSTLARALIGSGVFLAAGLLAALVARRRNQLRARRSGRTIARTPIGLVGAEQTVLTTGSAGGEAARFLDLALRDLAARLRLSGGALPEVRAARLSETHLELFLAEPAAARAPWTTIEQGTRWSVSRDYQPSAEQAAPPYPTLVSIGADDDGGTWLVDLEAAGVVQICGESSAAPDLARFIAAELAMNPWANTVDVMLSGVASELVPLNPARLSETDALDIDRLTKAARRVREAAEVTGLGVLEGRLDDSGADSWMSSILVADVRSTPDRLSDADDLLDELSRLHGRNAVALVAVGSGELVGLGEGGLRLWFDGGGRVVTPWATLTTNRLGPDEAKTLADLFAANDEPGDEPMPASLGVDGSAGDTDAAGALTDEVTDSRNGAGDESSLLPRTDAEYVASAATTPADLAVLAPRVPPEQRARVLDRDPNLDADLAAWSDRATTRPKLRLLGPVEVDVTTESPDDVERRTAYYAELVAYLASRPDGATPQQMAEAFSMRTNSLHSRIRTLRKWLGADPLTDEWYLPLSTTTVASKARGVPVYQLEGVVCDADLFKRLRTRGQARGSAEGIDDLMAALRLVRGAPFDQLRSGGYGWLAENPVNHYLTAAIVDVAHIVATYALNEGQPEVAAWAAERAITAAPSEDKPRLDLARAKVALGRVDESEEYVKQEIFNRSDDDSPPPEPGARTAAVLGLGRPMGRRES